MSILFIKLRLYLKLIIVNQISNLKSQKQKSNLKSSTSLGFTLSYSKWVKKLLFFICINYFLFLIFNFTANAAENFKTDYDVKYTVKEDGITQADMKISLTNTSSDYYYASSYRIELGFENITNIKASDLGGKLTPKSEKTENGYMIQLDFNKRVVGEGNKQEFILTFDTSDIAKKIGKIWEINIPGIDDNQTFNTFNVDLNVPSSFGNPEYIKPEHNNSEMKFTKDQLAKSGISLSYGKSQQYSFTLLYRLQNKNLFPINTEIAIPMNTNYQDIYIESIIPEPIQVRKDIDGNWLAAYELKPAEKLEITTTGKVDIYLNPRRDPKTTQELSLYMKERPYWQTSNSKIREIAKNLKTPKEIYDYVVTTLDYDFSRVTNSSNRLGAIKVLDNPNKAVCLEFTDLFITLARAAGIPTREVDGYAFTENPRQRPLSLVADILHAWPEYYDYEKQTWVMVDPTWADTTKGVDYFHTLDFDHFAFVKKGADSSYPIPAGGYKLIGEEIRKDVFIEASTDDKLKESELIIDSVTKNSYIAGFPIKGEVTVINKGPVINKSQYLDISANFLTPERQKILVGELLPYEKKHLTFNFDKQSFLTNKSDTVTMQISGKKYIRKINIVPIYFDNIYLTGGILIVLFTLTVLVLTYKARRIHISG